METFLLAINTLLLLLVLGVLVFLLYRLNQAWKTFQARQEQFERSLDTLTQVTDVLESVSRTLTDLREKGQWASDLGKAFGIGRRRPK